MPVVASYPFVWLPRWSRADAAHTRAVLRRLLPHRAPAAARDVLGARWHALLGGRVDAWPGPPEVLARDEVRARYQGVALAAVLSHRTLRTVGALIDRPFALTLASRALGLDEARARQAATADYAPAHEGALALLCAQAAALLCAPAAPPVVRAVSDAVDDATDAIGARTLLLWPWRVVVGLDAGEVTLLLDAGVQLRGGDGAGARDGADLLAYAGSWSLAGALVAGRALLAAREVAALAAGDVLVLEGPLALATDGAGLRGDAVLSLGAFEVPVAVTAQGVRITGGARARRAAMDPEGEGRASAEGTGEPAVRTEVLATLPVEVEVVLARGTFTVGEVSAWRVGEVVALPARVGEAVLVRAGGRSVARGELCDVDGEVGVRITELLG